ncbi:hypothetical protein AK830_g10988 [Neonectria ditissima]|uniref:Uncharacterized protein n=1 Tax=Neonectria ditissima TaxID=78410 RepID=A0A0N8H599_9HYPO|nr:hypothetical protein AK830_g10988 [Neonectria ditissima]
MSAPTDVSGDSGSDALDLSSSIGTWVAAGIAIIALVGVVAPFLALQASLSDNNRAMNAVQDLPQKYVTRGYRLTKGLRVLRRIRVPDLSPGYIANEPDTTRLVPLRAALGRWTLRPRNYLPWNTGWAKLAEVIEAYEVRDAPGNSPVDLGIAKGGALEVVNSRTALTVNKHWILLLGLLGRYGKRVDKGVLQNTGIMREFEGERASIQHFELLRREETKKKERAETRREREYEWERKKPRKRDRRQWSLPSSRSSSSSRSSDKSSIRATGLDKLLSLQRDAYGTWTLKEKSSPKIHGVTGTMQALGRHKGSWSYLTSISFVPHTAREIFAPGTLERSDESSMQTLFWLAHGFLPCGRTLEGRQTVISLESPASETASNRFSRELDPLESWPAFSLQEADDIPISIGNAMKCLGIPEPRVLQFLPLDAAGMTRMRDLRQRVEKEEIKKDTVVHTENDEDEHSAAGRTTLRIRGPWIHYTKEATDHYSDDTNWVFPRKDFERPLSVMLGLDWDDCGFLIRKHKFWVPILRNAVDILDEENVRGPGFASSFGLKSHMKAFRWVVQSGFHSQKIVDYLEFDKFLSSAVQESEVMPLRLALGTLFIIDDTFRRMTEKACGRMSKHGPRNEGENVSESGLLAKENELREGLKKVENEYREEAKERAELKEKEGRENPRAGRREEWEEEEPIARPAREREVEMERPIWSRISLRHVKIGTLQAFGMDYEDDPVISTSWLEAKVNGANISYQDSEAVLIKRSLLEWEYDKIWKHTAVLRSIEELKKVEEEKIIGVLEYDYPSKRLKWYLDEKKRTSYREWYLNGDLVRAPSGTKNVSLEEKEIVLVGLWTANRVAIWLSSLDSKPLLDFVEELDTYVYVL